jgi:GT2 family glycosyltransferase
MAVRTVDIRAGITDLTGLDGYGSVRCFVCHGPTPVGVVDIYGVAGTVSGLELRDAIVEQLRFEIIEADARDVNRRKVIALAGWAAVQTSARPASDAAFAIEARSGRRRVAVVIATIDRPDDLRRCLTSLDAQAERHGAEIVVCDNNPSSGLTAHVVTEFRTARLVCEPRRGAAYARNRAILATSADIVAVIDDDAVAAPDWLDCLMTPFDRRDVMAVTGNILPAQLDTPAQQAFEQHQPLGRGFQRWEADRSWFVWGRRAVPTWNLGGTCNAAFRMSALHDPDIGLMDEALGPGMPTGVGEDSYLLYRVLKAGHTVVYEPSAVVWHRHRRDDASLHRQLYGYYKGAVAQQLATLQRDGDLRAVRHLVMSLPAWYGRGLNAIRRGESTKPLAIWLTEAKGFVVGPDAYARSRLRVRRWGRSEHAPWLAAPAPFEPDPTEPMTATNGSRAGRPRAKPSRWK